MAETVVPTPQQQQFLRCGTNLPGYTMAAFLEPKPRLRWSPDLHDRFVEAVSLLGGAEKATPKSLMKIMKVKGLTLYHLKSHLQKFRLSKQPQRDGVKEVTKEERPQGNNSRQNNQGSGDIANVLKAQVDLQKQLQEQLEVQKRLQMRIEAQSRYLQAILERAEGVLVRQASAPVELQIVRAELADLVSNVTSHCSRGGAFGLSLPSSLPPHLLLDTERQSGAGEKSVVLPGQTQEPMVVLENRSPSIALSQSSVSGQCELQPADYDSLQLGLLLNVTSRMWAKDKCYKVGGHMQRDGDESQSSSTRTNEMQSGTRAHISKPLDVERRP